MGQEFQSIIGMSLPLNIVSTGMAFKSLKKQSSSWVLS